MKDPILEFIEKPKSDRFWLLTGVVGFILVNSILLYSEFYYFLFLPFLLAVLWLAFYRLDWLLYAVFFMVPLSIPLKEIAQGFEFDMNLPSEPLLAGILLLFIMKLLFDRKIDRKLLQHPISVAIYFYLGWMLITSLTSTMPVVSIKFTLAHAWFIVAFYFLTSQLFFNIKNIKRFIWLYLTPLFIVITYTLIRHSFYGIFDKTIAYWACNPFYKDHTSYGAVLAFLIPVVTALGFNKAYSSATRFIYLFAAAILIIALIFSYTRAAWIGVIAAFGVFVIFRFKISFTFIAVASLLLVIILWSSWTQIQIQLERNKAHSSENIAQHMQSISNVTNDASNKERLNRWSCAVRMFADKPLFGWGPGTFMFKYAPYQRAFEKSYISTNAGTLGNAHSEYLGPLSESGFFGMLSFIAVVICTIYTARRLILTAEGEIRIIVLGSFLGLVTYYLHGIMNNFLDTDKVSMLFWGYTAIIVAIDLYHQNSMQKYYN